MAANTALMNLSLQLAKARAGADVPNLKPLYRSNVDQTRQALGIVSGAINEYKADMDKKEADKNKGIEKLQGMAGKVYKSIYEMEETLPDKVVTAVENEIMNLQEEYERIIELGGNDAQEGSRALSKIEAQFSRIKNEALNLRSNLMLTTGTGKDNAWNMDEVHDSNVDPLMSIFDFENIDDNDNVSIKFVNGKITFTTQNYSTRRIETGEISEEVDEAGNLIGKKLMRQESYGKPISFNSDQIREMLPEQSREFETYTLETLSSQEDFGKEDAADGNYNWNKDRENDVRNRYIGQIKTKKNFQSAKSEVAEENIKGLKASLISNVAVPMIALNHAFVNVNGEQLQGQELFDLLNVNKDGDKVLDQSDLDEGLKGKDKETFKKVLDQLLDALTNIHNDAFNLDVSAGLLADYHTDYARQHYDRGFKPKGGIIPGEMTAAEKIALYSKNQ